MTEATETGVLARLKQASAHACALLRRFWAKRWFRLISYALAVAIIAWLILFSIVARDLPSVDKLRSYQPPLPTNVRGYDGTPVHAFARERRVELSYEEFPPQLVHAFISAEDKSFFHHSGVDFTGVAGAAIDYVTKIGSGRRARGGSTITQQVAKNLLVGDEYSIKRKLKEGILAYRIESVLTKQQILELYLNQIFLGRNAYGVQSASRAYFNKDVTDLALPELAYLAILPKAPSNYSPERHADRALERRNWVLGQMHANGYITEAQLTAARAAPLGIVGHAEAANEHEGGYFMEEVRRELLGKYGETEKDGPYSVYSGGLWVRSSYDPKIQKAAETALRDGLVRYDRGHGWTGAITSLVVDGNWAQRLAVADIGTGYDDWVAAIVLEKHSGSVGIGFADGTTSTLTAANANMPVRGTATPAINAMKVGDVIVVKRDGGVWSLRSIPAVSGGFIAEDPHSGRIMAMQGGFDARGGAFNRATQALRQPGSTFKPFVYAAALDHGMTPASIIVDGPFCVYQSARLGNKCFRNFSGGYAGPQTMRWGVEQSRNLMTVRAASQTGMVNVANTAKALGVGNFPAVLSIALGAGETTVLKITNAYSILANQGRDLTPTLIDYIQDRNGKVIYRADKRACEGCNMRDWDGKAMPRPPIRAKQVLDPMTAYQVVHIMEGVIQRGTATILRDLNRPIFGKTGTSSGPTNVWFVGGTPDLVAGVYMGYDHPRSLGGYAQGGTVAAPIWKQFAEVALKDMPVVPFKVAPGIRMVRIDRRSGQRVFGAWPTNDPKAPVIWEAFKPESEPRRAVGRGDLAGKNMGAKAAAVGSGDDFLQRQGGIY